MNHWRKEKQKTTVRVRTTYFRALAISAAIVLSSIAAAQLMATNNNSVIIVPEDITAEAQTAGTATLIVTAQVINDNGGTAQASDFTVCIVDYGGTNPEPQCFAGSESGTAVTLQASGQGYAVDQLNARDLGYEPFTSDPDCVRVELSEGSTYYCTIFFDDVPPNEPPQVTFNVEDDKGSELSDGGSTTSKNIEIKFMVTDDQNSVESVECSLDGPGTKFDEQFSPCTSPIELSKLVKGTYTFTVSATDEAGNIGTASFTWTVSNPAPPRVPPAAVEEEAGGEEGEEQTAAASEEQEQTAVEEEAGGEEGEEQTAAASEEQQGEEGEQQPSTEEEAGGEEGESNNGG